MIFVKQNINASRACLVLWHIKKTSERQRLSDVFFILTRVRYKFNQVANLSFRASETTRNLKQYAITEMSHIRST